MVKTEIIALVASALLLASCNPAHRFSWERYDMDAHRTGVTAPNADNVPEALGVVEGDVYTAPNGRTFPKGSCTYATALDMIAVQPEMAALKEVIGYSSREMIRKGANCEITNWIVDHLREDVARLTDRLLVLRGSQLVMDATPAEVFDQTEELIAMGLNVPQVTRIFMKLREMGMDVPSVYSIEQAVAFLKSAKEAQHHA